MAKRWVILLLLSILTSCVTYTPSSVSKKHLISKRNLLPDKKSFVWGINGHPVTNLDYVKTDLKQDIALLKEHQFSAYRFDVRTNQEGKIILHEDRFIKLLKIAENENISIHPVILINKFLDDYNISQDEAYQRGYKQMKGFAETYGTYINYYTMGNEQELRFINKGADGEFTSDYDIQKFMIVAAYLKGMHQGLKEVKPNAKAIINSAGWLHFGYYELLKMENVPYDILAYHWYSKTNTFLANFGNGRIIDILHERFQKPIWLTEINLTRGSYDSSKEQSAMMKNYIESLYKQQYVEGFFVYELYDQPSLVGQEWAGAKEANFGIVKWQDSPVNYNAYEYKPVSDIIRFGIEEASNGYEDYIITLYQDLLNTNPTPQQINYWTKELEIYKNTPYFIEHFYKENNVNIETSPLTIDVINQKYHLLLDRSLTEDEKKFWEKKLKKDSYIEVTKTILISNDYWERAIWNGYERRTGYKQYR